ncbi:hypothetical protein WJX81_001434 [Elliptochloris bilobata]|uniref:S-acyltransferase n=1 Tax=Elliptochloris bilobata TaxID=381761 RepID=A0AAW1QP40_9CHLO
MRAHGFQWPPNAYQAAALLVGLTLVAGYYSITVPLIQSPALRIAAAALYTGLAALTAVFYIVVMLTDPSDPGLTLTAASRKGACVAESALQEHCHLCQAQVLITSKHCRRCNRCTKHFDHHCVWLNNCIGGANYRGFIALLTAALALAGYQAAVSSLQLAVSWHAVPHAHLLTGDAASRGRQRGPRRRQIPVDIIELKYKYEIKADIPGVSKEVHVHDEDTLTINVSVERHEPEKDDPQAKYIRGERPSGFMSRTLRLPKDADPSKIQSKYQDGVLIITIGKKEEAGQAEKGRPIPVE